MADSAPNLTHRWFCGPTSGGHLADACLLNGLYCLPHGLMALLAPMLLFGQRYASPSVAGLYASGGGQPPRRLRYPFHEGRWQLLVVLLVLSAMQVAEGLLTDTLVLADGGAVYPQLFVPGVLALVGTLAANVLYSYIELWDRPKMLWLQVAYWVLGIINETVRFVYLHKLPAMNLGVMKYDISLATIVVYFLFLLMDSYLLVNRVFLCSTNTRSTYGGPTFASDALNPNVKYRSDFSSYLSSVSIWWLNTLFRIGKQRPLELSDLGELPNDFKAQVCVDELQEQIKNDLMEKNSMNINDASFLKVYWRLFGGTMAVSVAQKLVSILLQLLSPILLQRVIDQVTLFDADQVKPIQKAAGYIFVEDATNNVYALVLLLFLVSFFSVMLAQRSSQNMFHVSAKVRAGLQGSVYLKAQQLSSSALNHSEMSSGRITSHIGTDVINMQMFVVFGIQLLSAPVQIVLMLYLLYSIIGPSALMGAGSFLAGLILQGSVAKVLGKYQARIMGYTDQRLKETNELIQGIKLVKMNGWEERFRERVLDTRDMEVKEMRKAIRLGSAMIPLATMTYQLAVILAFGFYYTIQNAPLTPQTLFPAISLFQALSGPLMILPTSIMFAINAIISHNRIKRFLAAPEVEDNVKGRPRLSVLSARDSCHSGVHRHEDWIRRSKAAQLFSGDSYGTFDNTSTLAAMKEVDVLPDAVAMKIDNATLAWEDSYAPTLKNIDFEIQAGKLTAIVGEVGSGKSSVISALLGEMKLLSGEVLWNSTNNTIAYASQKAWLINASLRDNIVFGTALDLNRYNKVVEVCGLRQDIDILPAGDSTEIGEKGINLSGGQKQRVSVARAVYSHSDIVILDDPLSALDAHVGAQVFKEALKTFLMQEGRTVLLVTHQTHFLPEVDRVIVLKNGAVQVQGTPSEIKEEQPALYETWVTASTSTRELASASATERDSGIDREIRALRAQILEREKEMQFRKASRLSRTSSFIEDEEFLDEAELSALAGDPDAERNDGKTLIKDEERSTGSVSWGVYLYYIRAMGRNWVLLLLLLYAFVFVTNVCLNYWLSGWSEMGLGQNLTTTEWRELNKHEVIGYFLLSLASIVLMYLNNTATFFSALRAGRKIHKQVLTNITQSPVRFFDTTPAGRILNRFSIDVKMVDQTIGSTLTMICQFGLLTTVGLFINALSAPVFIVGLVPLVALYFFIASYYIATTRELKRMESITLSPVYSQFTETISGLSTVRAYNKQACFAGLTMDKINTSSLTSIYRQGSNFWLQFRLGFIGSSVILIAGLAVLTGFFSGAVEPGVVALALTLSLYTSQQLMQLVTQSAELEMQMNAVERLKYFANLSPERQDGVFEPPPDWPFMGDMTIRNIEMRYAKDLEPVLQGVNLRIKGGEKVGICGRTGSGKSSLMLAFFRLIDRTMGEIYIDGVNIDHVPLSVLRQRLSIVPQDPTLFTGTIRYNLDPFQKCDDKDLWEAIDIAQLKSTVSNLKDGLDSMVTEGGENFSVGQRQLFCLARAFLRKSRILIMDEATASIDKESDAILQEVLFSAFKDKTVLTIAHRVSTILSYDTIVVLSEGKLAEWDSPKMLLDNKDSLFSSLVNKDLKNDL